MLILLRHGRTKANARGLLQGRIDPELDELGLKQAAAAAEAIAATGGIDRVIASPLRRAQMTASSLGLPVETDERWVELDYGEWEGKPVRELGAETWERWRDDLDLRPPGGETLNELGARVRPALEELAVDAANANIVVVSHVSPIKAAVAWSLGVEDGVTWRMFLGQASVTRLNVQPGSARLVGFNDVSHLAGLDEAANA